MARTSDTVRVYQDESFSLGRPLIIGTIAGVIACYGFISSLGFSNYSNSFWRDGPRIAPVGQSAPTNQPAPSESQATAPEQAYDPNAPATQDRQQAPQSEDPMQNPPDDQTGDRQSNP